MKRFLFSAGLALAGVAASMVPVGAQPAVTEFQPAIKWHGRAVAVTVHPTDAYTAIVASESGGLFRTTDHGSSWLHIDTLPMFRMRDVKYGGGGLPVIATGWGDSRVGNRGGIWQSVDGGYTWNKPAGSNPSCSAFTGAWGIAFLPGTDNVYVGTDCGLAISRDNGATWAHSSPNPPGDPRIYGVVAHDNTGGFLSGTVDICGAAGHLRSTDSGVTFSSPTGSPAGEGPHCIAVSPVESGVVFVAARVTPPSECPTEAAAAVFEGDYDATGTITWTQVSPPTCRGAGRRSWVATNPSRDGDPNHFDIYFGTGRDLFRQTVRRIGVTGPRCVITDWTPVPVDHSDQNGMAFSTANNCAQFVVSDGGVHRPVDPVDLAQCGAQWAIAGPDNNGYHALQIYHVAGQMIDIAGSWHVDLYFGTQDNALWASRDGGATWPFGTGNEGWTIQVPRYGGGDFSHAPQIVTWGQPGISLMGPAHFESASVWKRPPGNLIDDPHLITTQLGPNLSPLGNAYVQYGPRSHRGDFPPVLKITTSYGVTWSEVAYIPFFLRGAPQVFQSFSPGAGLGSDMTLYQAYKKPGTLPSGEERIGLLKITGFRADGSVVDPKVLHADVSGLGSLGTFCLGEGTFICPVVFGVNPNDPSHLLAADVETSQMKVSKDGGANWTVDTALTDLVTGLNSGTGSSEFRFNIPQNEFSRSGPAPGAQLQVHAIAFDPFHLGHILVGTEAAGIIRSTNGGATWALISGSRKVTAISSFVFTDEFRNDGFFPEVVVSTYGRGLWKMTLPVPSRSLPFGGPPDWHNCWLRAPVGGCIMPEDLFDFDRCPSCVYHAVLDGSITDLSLSPNGSVQSIAIDSGRVIASTQDGQPVTPRLPILTSTNIGSFQGCPECASLVQQGGAVKGIVLEGTRLKAIIGGFGPLPGEDLLRQFSPQPPDSILTPEVVPPTEPYLRLAGTFAVGGQTTVRSGGTVVAAGSGFCSDPGCSPVVISISGRVVANAVPVDSTGNFQVNFTLIEPPGAYTVTAVQQTALGQNLTDAAQVVVPVGGLKKKVGNPPDISIGINFAADEPPGVGSPLATSDKTGVVPQANWNNLIGAGGIASSLVMNFAGSALVSSVSLTWSSPSTWASTGRGGENNGFPPGPDRTLMTGYLDTTEQASGAATVTVSGLGPEFTTRGYDVIVYALGGIAGHGGSYTIGSITKIGTAPTNPTNFVEDPGADMTDVGNFMRFANLRGASFMLTANAFLGNLRAPINAIQIVASPGHDFNDGTLPPGSSFPGVGNAGRIAGDGTGSNSVVHLTDANQSDAFGVFSIPAPGGDNIRVRWRSLVGGDTGSICGAIQFGRPGGDGYSMSWGTDLPNPPSYGNPGEEGAGSGLIVTVDTFDNGGGEAPGLEIKWRGARVAFDNINADPGLAKDFLRKNAFVEANLNVDTTGRASFTYDGRVLTATLPDWGGIPGGGCIMFAARTGGACDNHWIDDLVIESLWSDRPIVTSRVVGNQFQVLFSTIAGRTYTVEGTDSLDAQSVWSRVPGNSTFQGTGGWVDYNFGPMAGPGKFFRIREDY